MGNWAGFTDYAPSAKRFCLLPYRSVRRGRVTGHPFMSPVTPSRSQQLLGALRVLTHRGDLLRHVETQSTCAGARSNSTACLRRPGGSRLARVRDIAKLGRANRTEPPRRTASFTPCVAPWYVGHKLGDGETPFPILAPLGRPAIQTRQSFQFFACFQKRDTMPESAPMNDFRAVLCRLRALTSIWPLPYRGDGSPRGTATRCGLQVRQFPTRSWPEMLASLRPLLLRNSAPAIGRCASHAKRTSRPRLTGRPDTC